MIGHSARATGGGSRRSRAGFHLERLEERSLLSGGASDITATDSSTNVSLAIAEYSTFTPDSYPFGLIPGPDGNLWFTEQLGNNIASISPVTHALSEYPLPTPNALPGSITVGPDGNLWFTEAGTGALGSINPTTHAIHEYLVPNGESSPVGITAGPDGNLWFTDAGTNAIGSINPTTLAINEYPVPGTNSGLLGITTGPDGRLWFTESQAGSLGAIDSTSHAINTILVSPSSFPESIVAGPDGNLWFTDSGTGSVGMVNPASSAVTEFPLASPASDPQGITVGPDGKIWFSEYGTYGTMNPAYPGFGMIDPFSDVVTEFTSASDSLDPSAIAAGPDGQLWFADNSGSVGAFEPPIPPLSQLVFTAEPPAEITAGVMFGLTVAVEDDAGHLLTWYDGPILLTLDGTTSDTLGGTLSAVPTDGLAIFTGLSISQPATGLTLGASGAGLTQAVSTTINATIPLATTVAITGNPAQTVLGETVTLTATISRAGAGSPTGTVTFADNGVTALGTTALKSVNGVTMAVFSSSALSVGSHSITADYSGDSLDQPSTSAAVRFSVEPETANDFVGEGKTDLAVFRPGTDQWIIQPSSGGPVVIKQFGDPAAGDIPVPGDYDGGGKTEMAVFRPSTDQWIVQPSTGGPAIIKQFGDPAAGDIPVPGDYEGNGTFDLAVFRPSTDQWIIRLSDGSTRLVQFGDPAHHDMAVPGDYEGTGRYDLAVFRPDDGLWIVRTASGGTTLTPFGDPVHGDMAVPGDYDGDGKTDLAICRPGTDQFIIQYSGGGKAITQFGDPSQGDLPVAAPLASLGLITPQATPHRVVAPAVLTTNLSVESEAIAPWVAPDSSGKNREFPDLWFTALDDLTTEPPV